MRLFEDVQGGSEDLLLGNGVLTRRSRRCTLLTNRRDWRLHLRRQIHAGRVERVQRRRGAVRRSFLQRIFAVVSTDLGRRNRIRHARLVFHHVVGVEAMEVAVEATLGLQHQLELIQANLADCLIKVERLRHIAGVAKLILISRQVFILGNFIHQRRQLRLRTNTLNVELIFRQVHRDAKGLLERRIVDDRTDFIVLTRCVQVVG